MSVHRHGVAFWLTSLQLQGVTRLTEDKVDVTTGLVEISGEVKNDWRCRVVPIPGRVREALLRARQGPTG